MFEISSLNDSLTNLLKSPDALASIIASLVTIIGIIITAVINSNKNKNDMKKDILKFLLSKNEIKNILELKELKDKPLHKKMKITIFISIILAILIPFSTISHQLIFILAIMANMFLSIPSMMLAILSMKLSENTMKIYKFYESGIHAFSLSGIIMSCIVFFSDNLFHHASVLYGLTVYFLIPSFVTFNVIISEREFRNRYVSSKIKEKYAELPPIHLSLKDKELDGKLFEILNKSVVIKQNNKETVVMWKDIEMFSIDSLIENSNITNDITKSERSDHGNVDCRISNFCSIIIKKCQNLRKNTKRSSSNT